MPGVIRENDRTSSGGKVLAGSKTVFYMGRGVARVGDPVSCRKHGNNKIAEGNPRVRDHGLSVAEHEHRCECGCYLISSLPNSGSR